MHIIYKERNTSRLLPSLQPLLTDLRVIALQGKIKKLHKIERNQGNKIGRDKEK